MFHILWSIIIGFIVGWIAREFMGAAHLGFWMTSFIGIGGSLVGGFLGAMINKPVDGSMFHPAGFLMSIVGAVILLWAIEHFHLLA